MFKDGSSSVSARLHEHGSAAWAAATGHPMVKEIAAGTLPHQHFRHYFEQNIAYLEDYARAIAAIAAKAPDAEALEVLGRILAQIITVELPANRRFLERLGGDPGGVRGVATMEPTTYAYTRHLLATAALGDCAAGLTAVLPCQWSYGEIGADIAGAKPDDPIYADWVEVFGNPDYAELVDVTTSLLDRLADPDPASFSRLQVVFDASTRYEVEFWDMAYGPPPASF
ncbi:MAG TPA: TenA family protein [Acidimicrobiales bacterium]|nr:TenA family protein [Acidimicrobiales bacterium]